MWDFRGTGAEASDLGSVCALTSRPTQAPLLHETRFQLGLSIPKLRGGCGSPETIVPDRWLSGRVVPKVSLLFRCDQQLPSLSLCASLLSLPDVIVMRSIRCIAGRRRRIVVLASAKRFREEPWQILARH